MSASVIVCDLTPDSRDVERKPMDVIPGGCSCGFWSARNCAYVQAARVCKAPAAIRTSPAVGR